MSLCSGINVLAAAGLLDGRHATTHWRYIESVKARYPSIQLEPDVLYVDAGDVLTAAGSAAGIDLCLHVVRKQFGSKVANTVARRLVVPPHRDGGQAQFIERPVPVAEGHRPVGLVLQGEAVIAGLVHEMQEPSGCLGLRPERNARVGDGAVPLLHVTVGIHVPAADRLAGREVGGER